MQLLRINVIAIIILLKTTIIMAQTPGGPGTEDFPIEQTNDVNENSVPAVPIGNDVVSLVMLLSFGTWVMRKRIYIINNNNKL
ncbi:MAG: hypothetical protein ACOVQE_08660 [Chitinophagaceae bacterium]